AEAILPSSLLPSRATPEALIKKLANNSGIPSLWTPDEFGISLAQIYNTSYMATLEELLLTVYAGDDYTYERSMDSIVVRKPLLNIIGASTPESIGRSGATALESGLLPRFGIVYPSKLPPIRQVGNVSSDLAA